MRMFVIALMAFALMTPGKGDLRAAGDNDRQLRQKFNDIEQRRVMREIERNTRERDRPDNSLLMDRGRGDLDWCIDAQGVRFQCRR